MKFNAFDLLKFGCIVFDFLYVMIVSWHESRWYYTWIFGRSSRLKDVVRNNIIFFEKLVFDIVNMYILKFQFSIII